MRRIVFAFLWTTAFLAFVFVVLWLLFRHGLFLSLAITFCTTFYHFAFRLLAAPLLNASYNRKIAALYKPCNPWFREKTFEPGLYRLLRVRHWKSCVPTWSPETFSLERNSAEELAISSCQAEFIHEVNAFLSLLPIFASIPFGRPVVFLATSLLSALFELKFVVVQRYNRPRYIRLGELRRNFSHVAENTPSPSAS